jgi:hypothetical protein
MNMPEAEVENYNRLDARYDPQQVDERQLQNRVANSAANTRRSLANYANGSESAARASLLGSQANESAALSDAMAQAQEMNRQDNRKGQQFNLGIDQYNQKVDTQETIANAQNRAAVSTRKDQLTQALLGNLETVGLQGRRSRAAYNLSGGYDSAGVKQTNRPNLWNQLSNIFYDEDKKKEKGGLLDTARNMFPEQ